MAISTAVDALLDNALLADCLPAGASLTAARLVPGRIFHGVGKPVDSLAAFGSLYVNLSDGAIYEKAGPFGPGTWVKRWVLNAGAASTFVNMAYVETDISRLSDRVGVTGDYALVLHPLVSCALGDATIVGPKLPGTGAPGTWSGATLTVLSTVATEA